MDQRVVAVSGAARGIGAATVEAFAKKGYPTFFGYSQSETLARQLVEDLRSSGAAVEACHLDVRDQASIDTFAQRLEDTFGAPSVLVNNAGWKRDGLLVESSPDAWYESTRVNLFGSYLLCRRFLPFMLSQRWGRIINISSVAGQRGSAGQTAYCASKAAVEGLTRALAAEVSRRNVLVNAVAPGLVPTDMTVTMPAAARRALEALIPQRRVARAAEIGDVIQFLASDAASYISGQVVAVDGGCTTGLSYSPMQ